MERLDYQSGTSQPNLSAELSRFAFLIGKWRCKAKLKSETGEYQTFEGVWLGRFILDGHVIADEYRMMAASGELIVLGMNFRSFDLKKKAWNIRWLNALTGVWTDLTSEELGGVKFNNQTITYAFKEPAAGHAYTRATYRIVSGAHFTWQGERSEDGKHWSEFMLIEAHRTED
ncbi:MAG TPA: DUF1579 family protein [Candidatus Angelobacter sp.]|nr:DUF1579 family protein [Candidatus Angelobacter sp.]